MLNKNTSILERIFVCNNHEKQVIMLCFKHYYFKN